MDHETAGKFEFRVYSGDTPECTITPDWSILRFNNAFTDVCRAVKERRTATSPGELYRLPEIGDDFFSCIGFIGSEREKWERLVQQSAETGGNHAVLRIELDREDWVTFEVAAIPSIGETDDDAVYHLVFTDISESYEAGRRLARMASRFQAVLESSVDLNTSIKDPNLIYRGTLEKLATAIEFTSASIQLLEEDELRIVAHHGFKDESTVEHLRFPLDDRYPNARVVRSKRALALIDIRHDFPHFLQEDKHWASGHIRSWLGVPIIDRGEVWGMVTLDRDTVNPFDADDIELATAIANHAGVAITNSRLFTGLQRAHTIQTTLMQELHHRVKNNMQLISSLINIRASHLGGETAEMLNEIRTRILSLAAVHESLYQSPDLDIIDLSDYLQRVVDEVERGYTPGSSGITVEISVPEEIRIHIDVAIPLGLMLSEMLLNAVKHAFPADVMAEVGHPVATVRLSAETVVREGGSKRIVVSVADNGRGIAEDTATSPDSFGMVLVYTLTEQLDASVVRSRNETKSPFGFGTVWTVEVPF